MHRKIRDASAGETISEGHRSQVYLDTLPFPYRTTGSVQNP